MLALICFCFHFVIGAPNNGYDSGDDGDDSISRGIMMYINNIPDRNKDGYDKYVI